MSLITLSLGFAIATASPSLPPNNPPIIPSAPLVHALRRKEISYTLPKGSGAQKLSQALGTNINMLLSGDTVSWGTPKKINNGPTYFVKDNRKHRGRDARSQNWV